MATSDSNKEVLFVDIHKPNKKLITVLLSKKGRMETGDNSACKEKPRIWFESDDLK